MEWLIIVGVNCSSRVCGCDSLKPSDPLRMDFVRVSEGLMWKDVVWSVCHGHDEEELVEERHVERVEELVPGGARFGSSRGQPLSKRRGGRTEMQSSALSQNGNGNS